MLVPIQYPTIEHGVLTMMKAPTYLLTYMDENKLIRS